MKRRAAETTLLVICLAAISATLLTGVRWPLAGDSVLMHYVVFLTRHGLAPYRDIAEMNLPLTYLSEGAAMRVFGGGDVGWRLYDGALVVVTGLICWRLLREHGPAPGVLAAAGFAAVHLQDGVHMAGQRDLFVTVLEAGAGLALLRSWPRARHPRDQEGDFVANAFSGGRCATLWAAVSGALGMAAACIKPTAVLFLLAVVAWRAATGRKRSGESQPLAVLGAATLGAALPILVSLLYLRHFGALASFVQDLHGLIAYHASIERRPAGFLLGHAWSPVLPLVLVTAAALMVTRARSPWLRADTLAGFGVAAGLASYVLQGKGFPYQRYPFLLWLLLLCASRLWAAVRHGEGATWLPRLVLATPVLTSLVLIAVFLLRATHFSNADPYAGLRRDLRAHGAAALDGQVQCLDTAGPCIGALYGERLTQSTGFLYDCYLLDGTRPVVREQRALFAREWNARQPRLLVLTDSNCFTGPRTFDKYRSWPWMQQQLAGYDVVVERHPIEPLRLWSRAEQPYGYRLLQRR